MNKLEEKFYNAVNIRPDEAKQCAKITEQECIGFAEWLDGRHSASFERIDYKNLYQLYLKSKENGK